jgi:hypothetical protein
VWPFVITIESRGDRVNKVGSKVESCGASYDAASE